MQFQELKSEVKNDIINRALVSGERVVLASGQVSPYYFNCKELTLDSAFLSKVSELFYQKLKEDIKNHKIQAVAGVSVGGDPLVAGVLLKAHEEKFSLKGYLVRKSPKTHGLSQGLCVDGPQIRHPQSLCLLEDVVSSGQSSITALESLNQEGYRVTHFLCLIDREMGGIERIKQSYSELQVDSLFKKRDLVP